MAQGITPAVETTGGSSSPAHVGSSSPAPGHVSVRLASQRDWCSLDLQSDDSLDPDAAYQRNVASQALTEELMTILNCEHLVVLAGSGTSFSVKCQSSALDGRNAPSMRSLLEAVITLDSYQSVAAKLVHSDNIEHLLSEAQARNELNPTEELATFLKTAEDVVLDLCSFVSSDCDTTVHETFLRKVARRSTRLQRANIYTTNYDLAFEIAARRARFNLIDGFGYGGQEFDGGSFDLDYVRRGPNEQLALEPSVFHFLKLHGSVNWDAVGTDIRKVEGRPLNPVLIYPASTKYQLSYRQPYLEFMSRFQMGLRKPDLGVIVVGFGFNDDHLTAPIEAAIRSNVGMRMIVVTPGARVKDRSASLSRIEELVGLGDRRLSLLEATFDDFVRLLPVAALSEDRDVHTRRVDHAWASTPSAGRSQ